MSVTWVSASRSFLVSFFLVFIHASLNMSCRQSAQFWCFAKRLTSEGEEAKGYCNTRARDGRGQPWVIRASFESYFLCVFYAIEVFVLAVVCNSLRQGISNVCRLHQMRCAHLRLSIPCPTVVKFCKFDVQACAFFCVGSVCVNANGLIKIMYNCTVVSTMSLKEE